MKRLLCFPILFFCVALHANQKPDTPASQSKPSEIFIGWVDVSPNDWAVLGYDNQEEWTKLIDYNNLAFQQMCQNELRGRQVTGAKGKSDESAPGESLYVKFSNVRFDPESYALHVSIQFIDTKSGSEVASIPSPRSGYRGGHFSISSCLKGDFEKLAQKIREEIVRIEKRAQKR